MNTKIITIKELMENNRTSCMAPMRYFDKCYQCGIFKQVFKQNKGVVIKNN